jgi:hypothetical protein
MAPAIELTAVRKDYRGLRPLRILALRVLEREVVTLEGLDAAAADAEVRALTSDFFRLVRGRHLAVLITSADRDFVAASDRRETFDPATGGFRPKGPRPWFSRA